MNLQDATPAQGEAITSDATEIVAIAGPGSGKSATLVARIKHLVAAGVPHEQIAVVTFTNAGAGELERRLRPKPLGEDSAQIASILVGEEGVKRMNEGPALGFIGTLHAFSLRMLKDYGEAFGYGERVAVISPDSALDLLESKAKTLGCKLAAKALLELKRNGRPPRGGKLDLASTVVASYFDDLKEAGVVDYDALLEEFRAILRSDSPAGLAVEMKLSQRFTHLFVDEAQDSAKIDWSIYRALPIKNKFFVGDPDQSIYAFRGAVVSEFVFAASRLGVDVIKLESNFRSREEICAGAQRLIGHNEERVDKATVSVVGPGGKIYVPRVCANEGEEIGCVARTIKAWNDNFAVTNGALLETRPPTIAILARTNLIADGFRRTLPHAGIKVVGVERKELPRDWRLARAFVELLANPDNDALAFFYLVALYEKKGASPADARGAAHAARRAATAAGKSLNRANIKVGRIENPENAIKALAEQPVSREAQQIACDRFRELPAGAKMLDLAVALAEVREYSKEADEDGVHVLTMHGAKGREFDVVFIVGFEDEAIPGRAGKPGATPEALEEERRLAYVALTRARIEVYITSAESRVAIYGNHKEVQKRTPSRFTAEITG